MKRLSRLCMLACVFVATGARAQNTLSGTGADIAARGTPNGAAACIGCHGPQGEGNAAANFPRLAGQPAAYLARQLAGYAEGSRNNPVMSPIAKALNREQIDAVSSYYAALAAPAAAPAQGEKPTAGALQRGRVLASTGDESKGLQACANCHGPGGSGMPPTYPYLAGQHRSYLGATLGEWKSGARNTDPSKQMPSIAKRLNDADVAAVAAYYAMQPPPKPEAQRQNIPAVAADAPRSGQPAQSGASTPVQGVGVDQGTPTTGGGQGPGGGGAASGGGPSGTPRGGSR